MLPLSRFIEDPKIGEKVVSVQNLPKVGEYLSWHQLYKGFFRRFGANVIPCVLLAMIAFLPSAGLTLLSPHLSESLPGSEQEWAEYFWVSLLLSRFLTPLSGCLIVTYLGRKDGRLPGDTGLWKSAGQHFLSSIGLVLAIDFFACLAAFFFVIPAVAFLLGSTIGLSVLVIEKVRVPEAVRRSWERTLDVRDSLFVFWSLFWAGSVSLVAVVALVATRGHLSELWQLPLAESAALLPLVVVGSVIYGAVVCAEYEIYCLLGKTKNVCDH